MREVFAQNFFFREIYPKLYFAFLFPHLQTKFVQSGNGWKSYKFKISIVNFLKVTLNE